MQAKDLIILNVTGTNGVSRNQKTISKRFNGLGQVLDDNGQPTGAADKLRNLPTGEVALPPAFPGDAFGAAQLRGDVAKMRSIQDAYGQQLAAWERSTKGGNEAVQIAKSALEYAKEFHAFSDRERDDAFIMKLENIDVTQTKLADGRTLYTVAGTAVFGA